MYCKGKYPNTYRNVMKLYHCSPGIGQRLIELVSKAKVKIKKKMFFFLENIER